MASAVLTAAPGVEELDTLAADWLVTRPVVGEALVACDPVAEVLDASDVDVVLEETDLDDLCEDESVPKNKDELSDGKFEAPEVVGKSWRDVSMSAQTKWPNEEPDISVYKVAQKGVSRSVLLELSRSVVIGLTYTEMPRKS